MYIYKKIILSTHIWGKIFHSLSVKLNLTFVFCNSNRYLYHEWFVSTFIRWKKKNSPLICALNRVCAMRANASTSNFALVPAYRLIPFKRISRHRNRHDRADTANEHNALIDRFNCRKCTRKVTSMGACVRTIASKPDTCPSRRVFPAAI